MFSSTRIFKKKSRRKSTKSKCIQKEKLMNKKIEMGERWMHTHVAHVGDLCARRSSHRSNAVEPNSFVLFRRLFLSLQKDKTTSTLFVCVHFHVKQVNFGLISVRLCSHIKCISTSTSVGRFQSVDFLWTLFGDFFSNFFCSYFERNYRRHARVHTRVRLRLSHFPITLQNLLQLTNLVWAHLFRTCFVIIFGRFIFDKTTKWNANQFDKIEKKNRRQEQNQMKINSWELASNEHVSICIGFLIIWKQRKFIWCTQ